MRNLLLLLAFLSLSLLSQGQEKHSFFSKFSFKFQAGAGILTPGSYRVKAGSHAVSYGPNYSAIDTLIEAQSNKGIGQTFRIGGGINYNLNDFLILGVDFVTHLKYEDHLRLTTSLDNYAYDSAYNEIHYKVFSFSPHVTFKALAKRHFFIYNRLGAIFTLPFTLHRSGYSHSSQPTTWPPGPSDTAFSSLLKLNNDIDDHQHIRMQIGFNVALGLNFRMNDHWRFYAEIFGDFSPLVATRGKGSYDITSNQLSYTEFQDPNVDPPVSYFVPFETNTSILTTTYTEYQTRGATINRTDSSIEVPGNPGVFRRYYSSKARSGTYNMNVIGLNFGVIWRPRL